MICFQTQRFHFLTVDCKGAKERINFVDSLKLMDKHAVSSATKSHCFAYLKQNGIINRNFALLFLSKMIYKSLKYKAKFLFKSLSQNPDFFTVETGFYIIELLPALSLYILWKGWAGHCLK